MYLLANGYIPQVGDTFNIIQNDKSFNKPVYPYVPPGYFYYGLPLYYVLTYYYDPIIGTFANLPEGAIINGGAVDFRISYQGAAGHDVVLTAIPPTFSIDGLAPSPTAGVTTSFTVTARTSNGAIDTNYQGTVDISSTDTAAIFTDPVTNLPVAAYTFLPSDQGQHQFNVTFQTAGSQSISAVDNTSGAIAGEGSTLVNPGPFRQLLLTDSIAQNILGHPASFTVTAADAFGNAVPSSSYSGTVGIISSDPKAILPMDHTFVSGDSGVVYLPSHIRDVGYSGSDRTHRDRY